MRSRRGPRPKDARAALKTRCWTLAGAVLLPDRQTSRASMTYPRQSSTCCCCIPALLLLALLQLSAPSPSGAAIVGVTTDMEMDFSDLLLETMRASAAAAAAAKLRFSFAANTNNAWVPWPVNNASAPSQMEILMEFVHEIILMDYGSDCHDPSTGVPGMLCNPNDFLNRAWPWITHAALVNRRNAPAGRKVLITMATEPGPAIGPPAGRGGWDNTQAHTELELESFLNLSGAWLGWSKGQPACWSAKPPAWCRTVEYYSCFNSFNGFCPFHLFGIFEHTNWHNITDAFPCPGDEPVCQYRQPRSMWQYDVTAGERFPTPYGDLLADPASVDTLVRWCTAKNVQEIYFDPVKFPGCDPAADSTSAAGWKRLIAKLDSAKVNVQILVGDSPGALLPPGEHSAMMNCTRAAIAMASNATATA